MSHHKKTSLSSRILLNIQIPRLISHITQWIDNHRSQFRIKFLNKTLDPILLSVQLFLHKCFISLLWHKISHIKHCIRPSQKLFCSKAKNNLAWPEPYGRVLRDWNWRGIDESAVWTENKFSLLKYQVWNSALLIISLIEN